MQVLSVQEAAALLEVDARTVYRLIDRSELPAFRVGRQWRMRMTDLEAWIERQLRVREAPAAYGVRQPGLFNEEREDAERAPQRSGFRDSAFTENNGLPIHRWVPWIAGFSAQFVEDALAHYLPPTARPWEQLVLDPFAGVGTTLVTAMLRGHSVAGFEINPYAAEACELKLSVGQVPADELENEIARFERSTREALARGTDPAASPPEGFRTRARFFSPEVERKALVARQHVAGIGDEMIRRCFRIAFASEMVGFSNYSYEPSLCRRATAGKQPIRDADVIGAVAAKLRSMLSDIRGVQQRLAADDGRPAASFFTGSFFDLNDRLADASVDLAVTSPPYLNNYHYIRNSRPQVYWLDLVSTASDLKPVEQGSFGKFWQTVRGEKPIGLEFDLPALSSAIEFLRSLNAEKGQYGGPGWANYAATYFNDCRRFALALARLLKPGGRAVVVLGNSILQGVEFRTDEIFGAICGLCGLELEETRLLRTKRTGSSIIQSSVRVSSAPEKTQLYETAVTVRRPS